MHDRILEIQLAIIIVQLQRQTPTLAYVRAGVGKLLAFFKIEKEPAPSPAPTTSAES